MAYTKKHTFDEKVIDRINEYIKENDLSLRNIADFSGLTYQQLYQMLHRNQLLKLREYVLLCQTFQEPLERFVCDIEAND